MGKIDEVFLPQVEAQIRDTNLPQVVAEIEISRIQIVEAVSRKGGGNYSDDCGN